MTAIGLREKILGGGVVLLLLLLFQTAIFYGGIETQDSDVNLLLKNPSSSSSSSSNAKVIDPYLYNTGHKQSKLSEKEQKIVSDTELNKLEKEKQLELEKSQKSELSQAREKTIKNQKSFENAKKIYNDLQKEYPNSFNINFEVSEFDDLNITNGSPLFKRFMGKFFEILSSNRQSIRHPNRAYDKNGKPGLGNIICLDSQDQTLSESELISILDFPEDFVNDLALKHLTITESIPRELPFTDFYKGSGYVMVGGGEYSWYALLSIKTLRKVGSTLPVEVFLPNEQDWDSKYCNDVLPNLNAKCIKMWEIFSTDSLESLGELAGYQYKSFALLASSFQNVFLLDSDAFPVSNPDVLFDSVLYEKYGMITWADFWRRTTSPFYYAIAGIKLGVDQTKRLNDFYTDPSNFPFNGDKAGDYKNDFPLHDRLGSLPEWTSESGELLINKKTHFSALLLALYYNLDGPYGYYPLLSQGACGEGDKESFVAAAHFFQKPSYQVYKGADKVYGWYKGESHEHSTIVQYDPLVDFGNLLETTMNNVGLEKNEQDQTTKYSYGKFRDSFNFKNSQVLFYHVHDPKIDPYFMMDTKKTYDLKGDKMRNLGDKFPRFQFDLELFVWETIDDLICHEHVTFDTIFKDKDSKELCIDFIPEQLKYLRTSNEKINLESSNHLPGIDHIGPSDKSLILKNNGNEDDENSDLINLYQDHIIKKTERLLQFEKITNIDEIQEYIKAELEFGEAVKEAKRMVEQENLMKEKLEQEKKEKENDDTHDEKET